jgi:hypothetical protein
MRCNGCLNNSLRPSRVAAWKVVRRLLNVRRGARELMLRLVVGTSVLAVLFVTYWVHPTTAWIVLGSSLTLAVANRVRQRDEAEGALQTVDE